VAVHDDTFRSDDLEFVFAARGWAECVRIGHFETWRERFVETQRFFEPRMAGAIEVGNNMIAAIQAEELKRASQGRSPPAVAG